MKLLLAAILLCAAGPLFAAADLRVTEVQAEADDTALRVGFRVTNDGPAAAGRARVRLYLYSSQKLHSMPESDLAPLAAGESRTESLELQGADAGIASLRVEVFDLQEPDTVPYSNHQQAAVRRPGGSLADLEILEAVVENEQPVRGKDVSIRVQLLNRGPQAVPAVVLIAALNLVQDPVATAERKIGRIAAGEQREVRLTTRVPSIYPSGEGTIVIQSGAVDETIRDPLPGNNTYTIAAALVPRVPDLLPLGVKVDGRGELKFSVKNKGNAPAGPTTTALYVNGALVRRFSTPDLQAGGERRHQYGGTKILPGTQLAIVVDFNADVPEASEENNRFQFVSK